LDKVAGLVRRIFLFKGFVQGWSETQKFRSLDSLDSLAKIHILVSLTHLCLNPELLQSPRQVLLPQAQQQPKGGAIAISRCQCRRVILSGVEEVG